MWALTYRPTKLDEVLGQEHIATAMGNILKMQEIPPLMMVLGSYGSGKTTSLRILAMALTCYNRTAGEGCGQCEQCQSIINHQQNDNYLELDAASNGNKEEVEKIIKDSSVSITGPARRRVLLLDEAHQLSKAAQNSLLKLLEEGSPTTTYLMATTDPQKLLPTILSRGLKWRIKNIPRPLITQRLMYIAQKEGVACEEAAADIITMQTRGHVRDAITLLEQMSISGPINQQNVREYLELDKDTDVAKVLILLKTDRPQAYEHAKSVLTRLSPEGFWEGIKRVITEAVRVRVLGEQDHPIQATLDELNLTYGEMLKPVTEWLLTTPLYPAIQTEALCSLSLLQYRLIPESKVQQAAVVRAATPQRFAPRLNGVTQQPLTTKETTELLNMIEMPDDLAPTTKG